MVSRRDYSEIIVEAARSVLIEVVRILGEYGNEMVVVGGWVPELLLTHAEEKHIGSIDVDIALDHRKIGEARYKTIMEHLLAHGYEQGKQPFIFFRKIEVEHQEIQVEVDFLAGEYEGTGKSHRAQRVQDVLPRKARGVDLAFEKPEKVIIRGRLPNGGQDIAEIQVATIPSFIVMKAIAMKGRLKEKDAWDIYYCIMNYPGGLKILIQDLRPMAEIRVVQEALANLAEKFASATAVGPIHVADFYEVNDEKEREVIQRDAYERVSYLVKNLGVNPGS